MRWSKTYCLLAAIFVFSCASVHAADGLGLERLGPHPFGWLAADERSSNSAVFVGEDAALVVDPGLTPGIAMDFFKQVRVVIGEVQRVPWPMPMKR